MGGDGYLIGLGKELVAPAHRKEKQLRGTK